MAEKKSFMASTGLPKDPVMLLSVVNTKLRDFYPSLEALCMDLDAEKAELSRILGQIHYEYNNEKNQFLPIIPIIDKK